MMNPDSIGPMFNALKAAKHEIKDIRRDQRHWYCGGKRALATAVTLLKKQRIIAVPTDTVYGLAGLITNDCIRSLYEIKGRDERKPLAICVSQVKGVSEWGVVDNLPPHLLMDLLPGACTIILKRQPELLSSLNPDIDNVGIRVPNSKFIRCLTEVVGPLALTSANESSQPSSTEPNEFSALWPQLGGVFYGEQPCERMREKRRLGSTVIDLSHPGHYSIVRDGMYPIKYTSILERHGLTLYKRD